MSKGKYKRALKEEYDERFAIFMKETFGSPPIWDHRYHTFIKFFDRFLMSFNSSRDFDYYVLLKSIDFKIYDKHIPKNAKRR